MGRIASASLALAAGFGLFLAAQQPTFKVDVQLVRMLVTVKNPMGQLVGGLNPADFVVKDNDVPQEIAVFERNTTQPLSIALLIDTSRSTQIERKYQVEALRSFLKALLAEGNPGDTAALYSFSTDVIQRAAFTRRLSKLSDALADLKPEGATAMFDAIYLSGQELQRRDGRRVVVIVSDGGDTASRVKFEEALKALHDANAVLYALLTVPVPGEAGRNLRGENALITLTQWTGGRLFMPSQDRQFGEAFAEILRDLRTQYLIGFYPRGVPPSKNSFHRVDVQVKREAHTVSARNGYFSTIIEP
jgi:Ca-activated chloride channel family protein